MRECESRVAVGRGGLDLRLDQVCGGREKTGEGVIKRQLLPPFNYSRRASEGHGSRGANHRPSREEPPGGGRATARCHAADSSERNKRTKHFCFVCFDLNNSPSECVATLDDTN